MRSKRTRITAGAALSAAAITVISLTACQGTSSSASRPPVSASSAAATAPAPATTAPATTAPATTAPAPAAPATPALTVSQQQAVTAAQGYLSDGQGFSDESLTGQLTSTYGSGFSQADAAFAISYLHPDWYTQAVDAAKGYMALGGFSYDSLVAQLTSSYGNGFTYGQAAYAARQVGL